MIVPDLNGYGDILGDLAAQERAATEKHLVPASPLEFMKWVRETLREHHETYQKLLSEHKKLVSGEDKASLGLKRLSTLITFKTKPKQDHLMETHRNYVFKNKNVGYTLDRCKRVLDETSMNLQFVGETLHSELADKEKKKAVQRELGLRLRDIDADFARCKKAVGNQKKIYKQLGEGIQVLMNKAAIRLPPKVKEDMRREDTIAQIALRLKSNVQKDLAPWAGRQAPLKKVIRDVSFGEETGEETAEPEVTGDSTETSESSGPNIATALAAITVGLIIGTLIFCRK